MWVWGRFGEDLLVARQRLARDCFPVSQLHIDFVFSRRLFRYFNNNLASFRCKNKY